MNEHIETVWMEATGDLSVDELVAMSGLPRSLLDELIACGALPTREPSASNATVAESSSPHRFAMEAVALARAASRLREHFELDERGVAVAVTLLRRVRILEARVVELKAQTFIRSP